VQRQPIFPVHKIDLPSRCTASQRLRHPTPANFHSGILGAVSCITMRCRLPVDESVTFRCGKQNNRGQGLIFADRCAFEPFMMLMQDHVLV